MAIERIHFQKGFSLAEFYANYGTESQCAHALARSRWPEGFRCDRCEGTRHSVFQRNGKTYWQCSRCRHQTTVTAGTAFQQSKIPLTAWFLAMYLLTQTKSNVSALALMRHLDVSYKTAWLVKHKLLQIMMITEKRRRLGGSVSLLSFRLSSRSNRSRTERAASSHEFLIATQSPRSGAGPFVTFHPLSSVTSETWVYDTFMSDAVIFSSAPLGFEKNAGEREFIDSIGLTRMQSEVPQSSKAILGNIRSAIRGTYHSVNTRKYGIRYLTEAQFRFNRRTTMRTALYDLLNAGSATRAVTEDRIRAAEACT